MHFRALASLTKKYFPDLTFTTLEIGARKIGPEQEVFYQLPEYFPGSTVLGFEPDDYECEKMNKEALTGFRYYPIALGGTEGNVPFYQTAAPMCNSLLRPNKAVNALYNNMHFAELNKESEVYTTTIDSFVANNEISKVDLIKIDIQGAELKAFEAATQTLKDVSLIISEVEFMRLYEDQPLFGDIERYLALQGFMFHKFDTIHGRTLAPVVLNNNPNFATQHMWADAIFIRDLFRIEKVDDERLIKSAVLAFLFGSPDVTFFLLSRYDERNPSSNIAEEYAHKLNAGALE